MLDSPRTLVRQSIGLKAGWKVTRHGVLSVGGQVSHFESTRIATEFTAGVGTIAAPTLATGIPFSFGEDHTLGATGRGSVTLGGATSTNIVTDAKAGNIRYRYDNGTWKVMLVADKSRAQGGYRDQSEGHFRQMAISLRGPSRLEFRQINDVRPESLRIFDNTNREVNLYDINNYQLTSVNSTPRRTREDFESGSADLGRTLGFLSFPATVQLGAQRRAQTRDIRRRNENWTYNGINGDRSPAPFASPVYQGQYHYYGFRNLPHLSPIIAYQAYQQNPALFTRTGPQLVTDETFRINNSQLFEETVTAYYAQTEFSLFQSRLKVLTGVRYEKTKTEGLGALVDVGAVWAKNPDGTFVRNAAGQRVRPVDAGAVNSMEQLRLTHQEREYSAVRSYDGYYPSLHLNYNLADNLIARAAWAKTTSFPRPKLPKLISMTSRLAILPLCRATSRLPTPACVRGRPITTIFPWSIIRRAAAYLAPASS